MKYLKEDDDWHKVQWYLNTATRAVYIIQDGEDHWTTPDGGFNPGWFSHWKANRKNIVRLDPRTGNKFNAIPKGQNLRKIIAGLNALEYELSDLYSEKNKGPLRKVQNTRIKTLLTKIHNTRKRIHVAVSQQQMLDRLADEGY